MDKADIARAVYLRYNPRVRYVPRLPFIRYEKNQIAGQDFRNFHLVPHLRLLPGDTGHFQSYLVEDHLHQPRTVNTIGGITARSVGCPGVGTGHFDNFRHVAVLVRPTVNHPTFRTRRRSRFSG